MALAIATNTGALMAAASATSVNKDMETSMERLSTGKRINSAKDDAAGVAIASRLSSEIRGTNQAIRNASDGQALINTAEGAHKEVENILQRMRELAVQAANDTNDGTDRSNLQAEMDQLTTEIDRIAATTTWAGQNLLNGASPSALNISTSHNDKATFSFHVGAGTSARDAVSIDIGSVSAGALGVGGSASTPAVDGTSVRSSAADRPAALTVQNGTVAVTGSLENGDVFKFDLNGTEISVTFSNSDAYSDDLAGLSAQLKTAIDTKINDSSVSPSLSGMSVVDNGDGSVTLSQSAVPVLDNAAVTNTSTTTTNTMSIDGDTVTIGGAFDATDVFSLSINGVTVSITATASDAYEDSSAGLSAQLADAIRGHSSLSGVSAVDNGDGTVTLSQSTIPTIAAATVTPATAADATLTFEAPTAATATLTEDGTLTAGDTFTVSLDDGKGNAISFTSVGLTAGEVTSGAGAALTAVQTAFDALSDKKGYTLAAGVISRADGQDFEVTGAAGGTSTLQIDPDGTAVDLSSTAVSTSVDDGTMVGGATPNTLTIGGDFVDGKSYSLDILGTTVSIVADATDGFENSTDGLAQQLSQAINDAGIAGITASASGSGVDLTALPALSNGVITKDVTTVDATIALDESAGTITLGGTFENGDVYSFKLNGTDISLTIGADGFANDDAGVAAQLKEAIEAAGLPGVRAVASTSSGNAVVTVDMPLGTLSNAKSTVIMNIAVEATPNATLSENDGTLTISGEVAEGDIFTVKVEGTEVSVTAGEDGFEVSEAGVAAQMANAINNSDITGISAKDNGDGTISLSSVAISVTTAEGATDAITAIDSAIQTLNSQRANLGAVSNRLDNTINNLSNVAINLEGGKGRIEDADFAAESTALAKSQILQQASTAMLAQANASKQNVLSLLQG